MKIRLSQVLVPIASSLLVAGLCFADTTVIVNVNVVPMSSNVVLEQQTLIVVDDRIVTIGHVDKVPVPKVATIVDGTDRDCKSRGRHFVHRG